MYKTSFLKNAVKELKNLDKPIAQRLIDRSTWLAENIGTIQLYPLKGELSGLYKLRDGSYRIIYQILPKEKLILIHSIGHRKNIYKSK